MQTKFLQKNIGFFNLRHSRVGIDIFAHFFLLKIQEHLACKNYKVIFVLGHSE
jgi:hypothetical protein